MDFLRQREPSPCSRQYDPWRRQTLVAVRLTLPENLIGVPSWVDNSIINRRCRKPKNEPFPMYLHIMATCTYAYTHHLHAFTYHIIYALYTCSLREMQNGYCWGYHIHRAKL